MKRQVQQAGVRKYFGDDLVGLQAEPFAAIDAFFAEHGPCIIQGCEVTSNSAGGYDVAAGMVALDAEDTAEVRRVMVMPFAGAAGVSMPLYLSAQRQAISRVYGDGKSKPIAYDYKAVASAVKPAEGTAYLEITAAGGLRFVDVMQDAAHRFITDAERTKWNAAQDNAESHADNAAAEAEETAVRDAVLRGRTTGAVMGKGLFKSSAAALTTEVAGQPHTTVVVFVTPATASSGNLSVYNEGTGGNIGYGCHIFHTGSNIVVSMRGLQIAAKTVPLGTLCCVAVSYDGDTRCIVAINGTVTVKETPAYVYPHEPQRFLLGGAEAAADAGTLPGVRLVAARRFNFALTAEELTAIWNGGHPELWVVPAVVRNVEPSQWPSGSFTASAGTWVQNNSATSITGNVAAANGFSGTFLRATNNTPGSLSIYNAWRLDNKTADMKYMQLIEFEYRSDGAIKAIHGGTVLATFPANPGNAVTASYIAPAGQYTSLSMAGSEGTYIEIRTLRIVTLGCLLDLTPAGLTPTVWYDASGQGNDVPYVAAGSNPAEAELSDSTDGYPATTIADREALLEYAARYTEVREELLLRLSADEAARRDEAVKAYADEVGNTTLDAATAYTDEKMAEKQGKIANIAISDFDTFNPSNTAETKTLAYGEFVCFTSYDAAGRPDNGTSTYARICTGRITRLYGQYYRLEALTGGGSRTIPQTYTRLYINGEAQGWQAGTETFSYGTGGSVTLPSGLLIQWGRYSPATGSSALPISITFPKKFKTTPLHVTLTRIDSTAAQEVWSLVLRTYTTTGITVMPNKLTASGAVEATGCMFFWMALGQAE